MTGAVVRVLIADDSTTARHMLVSICEQDPLLKVVGEAADGVQAVELTRRLRPSVVLMDINMPLLDGLESTKLIMRETPTPILVVTSGTSPRDVEAGLSAVRNGALTVLPKPTDPPGTAGYAEAARRLVSMTKALADVKVIRHRGERPEAPRTPRSGAVQAIGVAASTGGPPAVCCFLQALPRGLPVPVLVVQHIAEGFLPGLIGWLGAEVPFPVTEARDGQRLEPGTVYLAGDGRHLEVDSRLRARLTDGPPAAGFRPSADVLFASMARALGSAGVGVVLTGMGTDGLQGLRALRRAGGRVLAQDAESCVVNGMPGAVVDAGLAHVVGPVQKLAADAAATTGRRRP